MFTTLAPLVDIHEVWKVYKADMTNTTHHSIPIFRAVGAA
jgi:hypothetical protein